MTVKELITLLETYDGTLEVICTRFSDYQRVTPEDIHVVMAVDRGAGAGYLMREHHYKMSDEDRAKLKPYLHFEGN